MIGFEVSKPLLERAFLETYDLKLDDDWLCRSGDWDFHRRSVSIMIPEMTRAALLSSSRHDVIW